MICSSRTPKINCMFFHPWLRSQHPSNLDVEDIEVLQKVMGTKIHQYEMSLESLLMNPWADTTASRRVKCRTESTWSADPCFKWWRTCCNIAMFMLTQRASTVFKRSKMSKKDISICIYIVINQSLKKKQISSNHNTQNHYLVATGNLPHSIPPTHCRRTKPTVHVAPRTSMARRMWGWNFPHSLIDSQTIESKSISELLQNNYIIYIIIIFELWDFMDLFFC